MTTPVLVPPLGQTVDTLTFVSWYKQEGDAVRQGEPLYVVETDKAALDVEAPASGILQGIRARPGDQVKALSPIATIASPGEEPQAQLLSVPPGPVARPMPEATAPAAKPGSQDRSTRLFVSPRARRLSEKEGLPLAEIKATGPQGAIVERDVRAFLDSRGAVQEPAISPVARRMAEEANLDWRRLTGTGPRGHVVKNDVELALQARETTVAAPLPMPAPVTEPAPTASATAERIPFTGTRAVIGERMSASRSQTASVTLTAGADATALVELRKQLIESGVPVSYNDFFLFILAKALREHPRLNASLNGDAIELWQRIDIGLAVDTDRGLLVPVVRQVEQKGLAQLAEESKRLTARARAGQCTPEELRGSTFTLTNLGMFGIDAFTPIINLPECAILGVGRIKSQPAFVNGQLAERQMGWLSLTFDHRLVDGGPAARFLQRIVQLVEKPHLLLA